jgi:hypothetical protein
MQSRRRGQRRSCAPYVLGPSSITITFNTKSRDTGSSSTFRKPISLPAQMKQSRQLPNARTGAEAIAP